MYGIDKACPVYTEGFDDLFLSNLFKKVNKCDI